MVSCVHKKRWGLRFTFFGKLRFIKVFGHKFIKFWGIMLILFGVLGSQKSVVRLRLIVFWGLRFIEFWGSCVHVFFGGSHPHLKKRAVTFIKPLVFCVDIFWQGHKPSKKCSSIQIFGCLVFI